MPTPIGVTPEYRLAATNAAVQAARPIGGMACTAVSPLRFRAHLELFARKRVLLIPAGVGVSPPVRRDGAFVLGGRCLYPVRTREPTGVIEVQARRQAMTLGQFFAIWGQRPRGRAYVNGKAWTRNPRAIPLTRHAQIVLEVNGYVRPHASYRFPPGL